MLTVSHQIPVANVFGRLDGRWLQNIVLVRTRMIVVTYSCSQSEVTTTLSGKPSISRRLEILSPEDTYFTERPSRKRSTAPEARADSHFQSIDCTVPKTIAGALGACWARYG